MTDNNMDFADYLPKADWRQLREANESITPMTPDLACAEVVAQLFHETYERLAPEYNYRTRKASAVPWSQVPENNRELMIAVAEHVLSQLACAECGTNELFLEAPLHPFTEERTNE